MTGKVLPSLVVIGGAVVAKLLALQRGKLQPGTDQANMTGRDLLHLGPRPGGEVVV